MLTRSDKIFILYISGTIIEALSNSIISVTFATLIVGGAFFLDIKEKIND